MKSMGITDLLESFSYPYTEMVDSIVAIGDVTAIRERKGQKFRRNYDRGFLILALAQHFGLTDFLEFGTGRGFVCACLLKHARTNVITTIDLKSTEEASGLIRSLGLDDSGIRYVKANANKLAPQQLSGEFDLVFIDAQHDGKSIEKNYNFIKPMLKPRSIVVFDDYRKKHATVKQKVDAIPIRHKLLVHTDGWIIPNKFIAVHGDADKVKDGKEYRSGMVVCSDSIEL
jgi:predicted O-methyltransferase YrrM